MGVNIFEKNVFLFETRLEHLPRVLGCCAEMLFVEENDSAFREVVPLTMSRTYKQHLLRVKKKNLELGLVETCF